MRWQITLSLVLFSGCGEPGADDRPDVIAAPAGYQGLGQEQTEDPEFSDDVALGPCKHEAKRECKVTLKVRNGIRTCVLGEQRCEGGKWGECKSKQDDD